MQKPTHLDLFSGIGGFALAAQWAGFRTIGFCEIDKYCQKVLAKNFLGNTSRSYGCNQQGSVTQTNGEGRLPESDRPSESPRLIPNIFDLDGREFTGVDLITGGFPCQPFSVAGKRRGAADDRAIWPEMFRIIKEARPAWVLGENVPGIIPMELDNVLSDLEGIGYATRAFVIPACAVDARHRRDRVWVICRDISDAEKVGNSNGRERTRRNESYIENPDVPNDESERSQGKREAWRQGADQHGSEVLSVRDGSDRAIWLPEPDVGRVAHGIPKRVDRLKGLGNAIVPQVAYQILREIRTYL